MFVIPDYIKKVMQAFTQQGFVIYLVGGAVRDFLLGITPTDFDLATNAQPTFVKRLAEQAGWRLVDKLGQNYGVSMICVDGKQIEVAAFRTESYGADAHRPEKVWFASTLEEDLARRDFTINAMAMDMDGHIFDPYKGKLDLASKIIRTVGLPDTRFSEDALRMFRACRFSAQLGFKLDPVVCEAISRQVEKTVGLSVERVTSELQKMLLSQNPDLGLELLVRTGLAGQCCRVRSNGRITLVPILPEVVLLANVEQDSNSDFDTWQHTINVVKLVPSTIVLRLAALLRDVGKSSLGMRTINTEGVLTDYNLEKVNKEIAGKILRRLNFSSRIVKQVIWLVDNYRRFGFHLNQDFHVSLGWIRQEAESKYFSSQSELITAFKMLMYLYIADIKASSESLARVKKAEEYGVQLQKAAREIPVATKELKLLGNELRLLFSDGKSIGSFLHYALKQVQAGELSNNHEILLSVAQKWCNIKYKNRT